LAVLSNPLSLHTARPFASLHVRLGDKHRAHGFFGLKASPRGDALSKNHRSKPFFAPRTIYSCGRFIITHISKPQFYYQFRNSVSHCYFFAFFVVFVGFFAPESNTKISYDYKSLAPVAGKIQGLFLYFLVFSIGTFCGISS